VVVMTGGSPSLRRRRLTVTVTVVVNGLAGAALGFAAWFAYAPTLQRDTGHVVDATNLPWWAIATGIVLAISTSVLASGRPATTVARVPVVTALSGRPAAPKAIRRYPGLRGRGAGSDLRGELVHLRAVRSARAPVIQASCEVAS
jgi:hypothetical protein